MPVEDFVYISPGVFTQEIDLSQPNELPGPIGPAIIGRFEKGPGMMPTQCNSINDFRRIFGRPLDGQGGSDWRTGNNSSPTYGAYAAEAWLKNNTPVTIIRLLGEESDSQTATGTRAGWATAAKTASSDITQNGGAWGLFLIPSASSDGFPGVGGTGSLAAVWYLNEGALTLSGTLMSGSGALNYAHPTSSANCMIRCDNGEATIDIYDTSSVVIKSEKVNFDPTSNSFIRQAFNTDPTLINDTVTDDDQLKTYFLGQTYENHLPGGITDDYRGIVLPLATGSSINLADYQGKVAQSSRSGWLFTQAFSKKYESFDAANMQKLFRFQSRNGDSWAQNNIKISIDKIAASPNQAANPYGSFSVLVRALNDTDQNPTVLESFTNLNLNPNSPRYVAKVIGDKYVTWDEDLKRYRERGDFNNNSGYIRMDMYQDSFDPTWLPFGFEGPTRFRKFTIARGSMAVDDSYLKFGAGANAQAGGFSVDGNINTAVTGNFLLCPVMSTATGFASSAAGNKPGLLSASFRFPQLTMRVSSSDGNGPSEAKNAYFGMMTKTTTSPVFNDDAISDIAFAKPAGVLDFKTTTAANGLEVSSYFTLDDMRTGSEGEVYWESGSAKSGISVTQTTGSYSSILGSPWRVNKFTLPLYGGTEGLNILERDPFNNTDMKDTTARTNYAYFSIEKAIDMLMHPEDLNVNIAAAPGVTNTGLTKRLLDRCTDRGDVLAVIDLEGGYLPPGETNDRDALSTYGSVSSTVTNIKLRALNTSYGCAYYPWVQIRDTNTNNPVWVPPSVAAIGVMSNSQNKSELWFAPAGFNRGGLNFSAGLAFENVREKLSAEDRDDLYEVAINPIAKFPSEGIVVFGQKTLQATPSALDRVNVRRLLIHIKKEITRLANKILFDQNVEETWNRFLSEADPFLASIKARLGLEEYRLILDKTTTTPDLVDRNALYAKIILKPAKAIEFILLDFVITNTGAEFSE